METLIHTYLPWFIAIIIVLSVWDFTWKGFALWRAARNKHVVWFICIFIINSIGILPIIYLILHKEEESARVE